MSHETPEVRQAPVDGLLLSRDLMFTSKVTGTAAALGLRIETVGSLDSLKEIVVARSPRVVFLDLAWQEAAPADLLRQLDLLERPRVVAFGPHVDAEQLQSALQAGCDEALPRSRFSATLPDLMRRLFHLAER